MRTGGPSSAARRKKLQCAWLASAPGLTRPLPAEIGRYTVEREPRRGRDGARAAGATIRCSTATWPSKHLRGDLTHPADVREGLLVRMRHEARAAARVPHPNLVALHDMGEDPAVGLYLVFEYVEGPTLKQRLAREGRLAPAQAAQPRRRAGRGAHDRPPGRDRAPRREAGEHHASANGGKIADFGSRGIPDSTLTAPGRLMGTPAYSAPETFRVGKFSPASDQFSLAAVAVRGDLGAPRVPGRRRGRCRREDHARRSRSVTAAGAEGSPAVDEISGRALSRTPEDRFPSCEAFGAALARARSAGGGAREAAARTRSPWACLARGQAGSAGGAQARAGRPRRRRRRATAACSCAPRSRPVETPPAATVAAATPPPASGERERHAHEARQPATADPPAPGGDRSVVAQTTPPRPSRPCRALAPATWRRRPGRPDRHRRSSPIAGTAPAPPRLQARGGCGPHETPSAPPPPRDCRDPGGPAAPRSAPCFAPRGPAAPGPCAALIRTGGARSPVRTG